MATSDTHCYGSRVRPLNRELVVKFQLRNRRKNALFSILLNVFTCCIQKRSGFCHVGKPESGCQGTLLVGRLRCVAWSAAAELGTHAGLLPARTVARSAGEPCGRMKIVELKKTSTPFSKIFSSPSCFCCFGTIKKILNRPPSLIKTGLEGHRHRRKNIS